MIYIVVLVFAVPLMFRSIFNMLTYGAAKVSVDDLHSLADTENGPAPFDEQVKALKLKDIQLGIDLSGTVILLAEEGGRNVSAAGKEQSTAVRTLFRV